MTTLTDEQRELRRRLGLPPELPGGSPSPTYTPEQQDLRRRLGLSSDTAPGLPQPQEPPTPLAPSGGLPPPSGAPSFIDPYGRGSFLDLERPGGPQVPAPQTPFEPGGPLAQREPRLNLGPALGRGISTALDWLHLPSQVASEGVIGFVSDPTGMRRWDQEQRFREEMGRKPTLRESLTDVPKAATPLPWGVRGAVETMVDPLNWVPGVGFVGNLSEKVGGAGVRRLGLEAAARAAPAPTPDTLRAALGDRATVAGEPGQYFTTSRQLADELYAQGTGNKLYYVDVPEEVVRTADLHPPTSNLARVTIGDAPNELTGVLPSEFASQLKEAGVGKLPPVAAGSRRFYRGQSEQFAPPAAVAEAVQPPGTAMQASMGIGERPPQGELFAESATAASRQPLADPVQLQAQAARREAVAQGQTEFPAPAPALPESPLEAARQAEAEAVEELTGAQEWTGMGKAPAFGSRARAEYDAARMQASQAGRPVQNKAAVVRQARAKLAAAQENIRVQENALAARQMMTADAADASRSYRQEGPGSVETFAQTSAAGQPPSPPIGISPSGGMMEGGHRQILAEFQSVLQDPARADEWQQTLLQRSTVLAGRSKSVRARTDALVEAGLQPEQAMREATKELAGTLPTVKTPLHQLATPAVRDALFQEVYLTLADEPLEMIATSEALANALAGRAIPRTPGTRGGSAYSRLMRVFGDVMTKTITQQRSLEEVIALQTQQGLGLSKYRPAPGPFISMPGTQGFGSVTPGAEQRSMLGAFEEPALLPPQQLLRPEPPVGQFATLPADLRTPAQRKLDMQRFREATGEAVGPIGGLFPNMPEAPILSMPPKPLLLNQPPGPFRELGIDPRTLEQKQLDIMVFKELTSEASPPVGGEFTGLPDPRVSQRGFRAKDMTSADYWLGRPPEDVLDAPAMISQVERNRMLEWAKAMGLTTVDLGNLVRANVATVDLSYLRQQALLVGWHPVAFAKSFKDALRGVWSAEYAQSIDNWIKNDPDYKFYEMAQQRKVFEPSKTLGELGQWVTEARGGRDFLRPLDGRLVQEWERAEEFIIKGGNRPLQKLADRIPWINISSRAYITGMNSMNWHIYKGYLKTLHRQNEQIASGLIKLKPLESFSIAKEADSLASMLADMSGRGPVGPLKAMTPALNAGFFSLRTNIGRFISPRHLFSRDKWTRGEAWKNFLAGIGVVSGVILAGREMGLWDVETDRRSSDYMKIIIANRIRIDPWGGYQQFAVLYGRLLPLVGGIKSTTTGEVTEYDPITGIGRFVRNKASPMLSQAMMAWTGKDFKGEKIDRTDWRFWLQQNAPLSVQTIIEAFEAEGLAGLALAPLSGVGMGVQVHEESLNSVAHEFYGMDYDDLPKPYRTYVDYVLGTRQTPEQRLEAFTEKAARKQEGVEREAERWNQFQQR